jgi:Fe2+ or Zn2+ uptake regulation protein
MKRNTTQKRVVMEALHTLGHTTAAELYAYVREQHPTLGLSTVYRILRTHAEAGLIRCLSIPGADDVFDATLLPHSHIRCTACGRVHDLGDPSYAKLVREADDYGFSVTACACTLLGLCAACRDTATPITN